MTQTPSSEAPGATHVPLESAALRRRCETESLPFQTTGDLETDVGFFGQERALEALRLAVSMRRPGYNVFVLGPTGVGKHAIVQELLAQQAAADPTPDEWVYVNDFGNEQTPRAIPLPPGTGKKLAKDMQQLVAELRVAIPAAFESRAHADRIEQLQTEFKAKHEALFGEIERTGRARGIAVLHSPSGVVFAPLRGNEVLGSEEFEKLPAAEKERLKGVVHDLQEELSDRVKELPRIHTELRERLRKLDEEVTRYAVDVALEPLMQRYTALPSVVRYLEELRADVVEHAALFRREKEEEGFPIASARFERWPERYAVNVLVDRSEQPGAPVVYDDHPTFEHLTGRIEHYAELGTLVTNFTLIKSGSLHRANGGYLLLDAHKVLTHPYAWDGLKRALFGRHVQIEPLAQVLGLSAAESLRPQPIPLDVKVVVFGPPDIHHLLSENDTEFLELFKIAADFEASVDRTPQAEQRFAGLVGMATRQGGLRPFGREAVALLIEECSRLAGDSRKLSTNTRRLFEWVQESDHVAAERDAQVVDRVDVVAALGAQQRQRQGMRDRLLESVARRTLMLDVAGTRVGVVNGLAAASVGGFAFGRPTRITATARIGDGRVIDIEREVELGGPLHSKGVLILTNYVAERYAKRYPLSLLASLVFEQSYWPVEGDSASLAELCALLSALAGVPAKQAIAVTGSVNQFGQVQAVGAVNEKVEGFFDTCAMLKVDGSQGVIVPKANVEHLMLREDVVSAARRGEFHVYAVETVDDAMEILTGLSAGVADENGEWPPGTLNHIIEEQLIEFAVVAKTFGEISRVGMEEGTPQVRSRRRRARRRPK